MGFRTVCIENRSRCSYMGGYLVVTQSDVTTKIHLSEISSVMFATPQVYVSGHLIAELAKNKIPVVFCDDKYLPAAESLPLHGSHNCSLQVRKQLEWSVPSKKRLWQRIVQYKISLQADVLDAFDFRDNARVMRGLASEVKSGDTTNREAIAAAHYFSTLFGEKFNRDLDIPVNALFNYGYAVIMSRVAREITIRGCLTHCGINHHSEYNQWNFASDLMEPFRPFVDYVVLSEEWDELNTSTKRELANITNRLVPYQDGSYKLGSVISLFVKQCVDILGAGIPLSELSMYELP